MAKLKLVAQVKLQIPAGKATAGPPIGSSLGPHGINIGAFVKEFNEKTAKQEGLVIPVVVSIFQDKSFSFVMKTPPASVLIKKACGLEKGSKNSKLEKVAKLSKAKLKEIATLKMPDLNASSVDKAMSIVAGTARSMGITIEEGE